ncbi:hypothetical protein FO519_005472 [Halicephalobus sp. NKZ332]|nr:hypothetical protein FO519_005472 [Halicephalobus sp. NKZ332]
MIKISIFFILTCFTPLITSFPPAISFSPYKFSLPQEHHSICKYCLCDQHQKSVICAGAHILINTVHLPPWAASFHVHNITLPRMPHFGYSPSLKVLRINYCGLSEIHPLSFVPLPNLETIHLADNELNELSESLLSRMEKLRILNLARNRILNLSNVEFALPDGLILEQLVLDGNPIRFGFKEGVYKWPVTRQVHMADTRMEKLNGSHIVFESSPMCISEDCRYLSIPSTFWSHLVTADFGSNPELNIHSSVMPFLANLTALNLAETHLPTGLSALFHLESNLRHLDLHKAKLEEEMLEHWHYCNGRLEWLDISEIYLKELNLGTSCSSLQWLFASGNRMTKATIDSRGLRVLHLDRNELTSWPFPSGPGMTGKLRQLETLLLGTNRLTSLPEDSLKGFVALTSLDLSNNKLLELHKDAFPSVELELRYLNISFNLLDKFPELVLPKLQVLDLSGNELGSMSLGGKIFIGMPNLQHLHLNKNPGVLEDCRIYDEEGDDTECWLEEAKELEKLTELDLAECEIKNLPNLRGFQKLQSLNLAENEIDQFDSFQFPKNIMNLNLRNNKIHSIGNLSLAPAFTNLQNLDLAENPLSCDCSLFSVLKLLQRQTDFEDRSIYYCFAENWQHPLKSYLESAEHYCDTQRTSYGPSIWSVLFNFLGLLITCLLVAFVFAFILLKIYKAIDCKLVSYAPVPQENPVEV